MPDIAEVLMSHPKGRKDRWRGGPEVLPGSLATLASAMSEDELLTRVLELLALFGWRRQHVRNSRAGVIQGDIGFPDVVAAKAERGVLFAELKDSRRPVTAEQQVWLETLALSSPDVHVYVWRPAHYLTGRIENVLRGLG